MNQVRIDLENCYGIRKLSHCFDFAKCKAYAVYAPNGSMKTSLAQTFKDIANSETSIDRIFTDRKSTRRVTDESGKDLSKDSILVLAPYDEFFGHTEKTSTLLVNNVLRKEYEQLHADIDKCRERFLKAMKTQSRGSKKELVREIALAFMKKEDEDSFYLALERARIEVEQQKDAPFKDVEYDAIFDDKVLDALKGKDVKSAIEEYINRYNALLAKSTYFKKGVFEYYNASQIAKALADNGFFDAKHTITLYAAKPQVICTTEELEELVKAELEQITEDEKLKKTFASLKKLLEKNVNVRTFQKYLCDHELLLPHLANLDQFKEDIWRSYFKSNEAEFNEIIDHYRKVKTRRSEIEEAARKERTLWENAIDLFNDRFFVPFRLEARNKAAVVLEHEPMLDLTYTFQDGSDSMPVVRETLMKTLSQGEKKALYILNIIFEIEVRRQNKQETLFLVDDIADSFDYKNKYAIIQYLEDISDGPVFKQVILTHNFDFFRTISTRFVGYDGCLMASRSNTDIVLSKASGIKNIFVNDWKTAFFTDSKKRIASIPFMRNLIEFTQGASNADYLKLTSLLHWKTDSASITQGDLDAIYNRLFGSKEMSADTKQLVIDAIEQEAKACLLVAGGVNFEHKIVLSIAIRLAADRYMDRKIADAVFSAGITGRHTNALFKKFQQKFPNDVAALKSLQSVLLMTPENIHLNAFMYEPILDMSDDHLRKLYTEVISLKS